jgi:hypothetical protein
MTDKAQMERLKRFEDILPRDDIHRLITRLGNKDCLRGMDAEMFYDHIIKAIQPRFGKLDRRKR